MSSASPTDAKARGLGQPKSVTGRLKNAITSRRLKSALGIKKLSLPTLKVSPGAMAKALKARMARGLRYDDEIVLAKTRIKIADEKFDPRRFVDVRPFTKTFFPELDIIADADELNDYRKIFSKVFNSVAPGEVPLSPCNTEERDIIYQGLYTWRDSLKGEVENLRRSGRAESFDMENRMRVLGDLVYLISEMEKRDADGVCTNYTAPGTSAHVCFSGAPGEVQASRIQAVHRGGDGPCRDAKEGACDGRGDERISHTSTGIRGEHSRCAERGAG
jgi:hypothetical protein